MNINVTLSLEQAEALHVALETHMRIGMGQISYIVDKIHDGTLTKYVPDSTTKVNLNNDEIDHVAELLDAAAKVLGHSQSSSFGIGHPHVDITAKRAYELKGVLANAISDATGSLSNPATRHSLKLTDDVQAQATLTPSATTLHITN